MRTADKDEIERLKEEITRAKRARLDHSHYADRLRELYSKPLKKHRKVPRISIA